LLGLPEMTSASPPEFTVSLLSDEEKWFFDNFGYLVLKQAVPPNDATELLVELDGWLSSTDEPPTPLKRGRQDGSTRRENVVSPHDGSAAYPRLNHNAEILRVVSGMMMGCPRLMHTVATKMWRLRTSPHLASTETRTASSSRWASGIHTTTSRRPAGSSMRRMSRRGLRW
jgi:hypothetical protein